EKHEKPHVRRAEVHKRLDLLLENANGLKRPDKAEWSPGRIEFVRGKVDRFHDDWRSRLYIVGILNGRPVKLKATQVGTRYGEAIFAEILALPDDVRE